MLKIFYCKDEFDVFNFRAEKLKLKISKFEIRVYIFNIQVMIRVCMYKIKGCA